MQKAFILESQNILHGRHELGGYWAGRVTTDISIQDDMVRDVVVQSDGKIVVIGVTNSGGLISAFALARYQAKDGSLDQSFGASGIVTTQFSGKIDAGYAIDLQADGKILAGGFSGYGY